MRFERHFRVNASRADVARFHQSARSLQAITPLPLTVHEAPDPLASGDELIFTMWMGPLPVRWHGRVEDVSEEGFDDLQVSGPFSAWLHRHNFVRVDDATTEVHDVVEAELPRLTSPWYIVAASMWIGLPLLFLYREWRTRRLVER